MYPRSWPRAHLVPNTNDDSLNVNAALQHTVRVTVIHTTIRRVVVEPKAVINLVLPRRARVQNAIVCQHRHDIVIKACHITRVVKAGAAAEAAAARD